MVLRHGMPVAVLTALLCNLSRVKQYFHKPHAAPNRATVWRCASRCSRSTGEHGVPRRVTSSGAKAPACCHAYPAARAQQAQRQQRATMIAYEDSEVPAAAPSSPSPHTHTPNPHARPRLSLASAVSSPDEGDSSDYEAAGQRPGSRRFATRRRFRSKYGDRPVVGAGLIDSSGSDVDVPVTSDSGDDSEAWRGSSARAAGLSALPAHRASGRVLLPPLNRPSGSGIGAAGASDDEVDSDGDVAADVGTVVEVSGRTGKARNGVTGLGRARAAGMAARWVAGRGARKGKGAGKGAGKGVGSSSGDAAPGSGDARVSAGRRPLPRPQSRRIFPELDVANEEDREYMGSRSAPRPVVALALMLEDYSVQLTVVCVCHRRILLCVSALVMVVFLGALTVLLDDVYELMEESECVDSDGDTVACTHGACLRHWLAVMPCSM